MTTSEVTRNLALEKAEVLVALSDPASATETGDIAPGDINLAVYEVPQIESVDNAVILTSVNTDSDLPYVPRPNSVEAVGVYDQRIVRVESFNEQPSARALAELAMRTAHELVEDIDELQGVEFHVPEHSRASEEDIWNKLTRLAPELAKVAVGSQRAGGRQLAAA